MSGPESPFTEEEKALSRRLHRRSLRDALDKARRHREKYKQLPEDREVSSGLNKELDSSTFRLYLELRPVLVDTEYEPTVRDIGEVLNYPAAGDEQSPDRADIHPQSFVGMIDWMEWVIGETQLLEVDS